MIIDLAKFNAWPEAEYVDFQTWKFPGGEWQVKILPTMQSRSMMPYRSIVITSRMATADDLMQFLMAVDAVRRMCPDAEISAFLPYMPYARQDRVCAPGESLSIAVMANILNALKLHRVVSFDVHSDVTPALVERMVVIDNVKFVVAVAERLKDFMGGNFYVVAPDAGAAKKASRVAHACGFAMLQASKSRNVATGEITGVVLDPPERGPFLVVDDICDGGRTFLALASLLHRSDLRQSHLVVTHGIFSNGTAELKETFAGVWTTPSLLSAWQANVIPWSEFFTYDDLNQAIR